MTTLIAWVSLDQNDASAIYLASDSRLSWGKNDYWDAGRKIFASEKFPEILGYTGDAFFCTQVLGQIVAFIDSCAPLIGITGFEQKFDRLHELIKSAFSTYPNQFCLPEFSILYATRIGRSFGACTFRWKADTSWLDKEVHYIPRTRLEATERAKHLAPENVDFDAHSNKAEGLINFSYEGSGAKGFRMFYFQSEWAKKLPGLSRSYFGAFCDYIESKSDQFTGGRPQLVALFRDHEPKKHGFVDEEGRHLYGILVSPGDYQGSVRWVNRNFENCDPIRGGRLADAQRQPNPSRQ